MRRTGGSVSARAGLAALLFGAAVAGSAAARDTLSADAAHEAAAAGRLLLIDIRTPQEWADTGVAASAIPLDMREDGFAERLAALVAADPSRPVAVMCRTGGRSGALAAALAAAGAPVLDVSEGMLGSAAGPGWIARALPVAAPDDARFAERLRALGE